MESNKKIRLATEEDCTSILKIYAPFITDTAITFECQVPAEELFRKRMNKIQKKYPWIVCEIDGTIAGYAYASPFNEREAYDWSADFSVYVNPKCQRRNIGKALYFTLIEILRLQGFCNIYAIVTLPNVKSESLHESFGFKTVGIYNKVGYKFGSWRDVKWYGLTIKEHSEFPEKPKPIDEVRDTDGFKAIIEKAERMIKD